MAVTHAEQQAWNALHKAWAQANDAARVASRDVTKAFAACAHGQGAGPSDAQLAELERLEAFADKLSGEMDNFMKNLAR